MTARPRALLLDQWGHFGGAQRVALEVMACWRAWGWDLEAAFPLGGAFEAAARREFGDDLRLHDLALPAVGSGRKSLGDAWRLWRAGASIAFPASAAQASLVHVNGPRLYAAWRRRNRAWQRPTAYHVHLHHGALERALITRYVARDPQGLVLAVSREVAAGLGAPARPDDAASRVCVVENAVPRALAESPFVDRWAQPLRWVVVGEWRPEKGQDIAIAAARALPEWELLLVGPTLPAHAAWAQAVQRELPPNVRVLGAVPDVPATLAAEGVQAIALPSRRRESFSMAVAEGIASSCAAVMLPSAGAERLAEAAGVPRAADAAALAATLRTWGKSPSEGREVARRQHAALIREFGAARFEAALQSAYRRLLAD